jgi:serine protease AprX
MAVRRICFVIALLLLTICESNAAPLQYAFRVGFRDKNGSPSLANPLSFLSLRSLDRRNQQGLSLDSTDRPIAAAYIDSVLIITGGKLHNQSRWFNQVVILLDDSSKILLLGGKPFIKNIEFVAQYDFILHLRHDNGDKTFAVNTQLAKTTAYDQHYYEKAWPQNSMVNGPALHNMGYRGKGVIIAVFDGGFKGTDTHPGFDSLRQSGRLLDLYDFTLRKKDTVYRYDYHGTECLSTIAGVIPGTYVGSAPDASYVLYRTEDSSSEQPIEMDNLLAGLERADSLGVDVVSCSLGYRDFDSEWYTLTIAQRDGKSTMAARAVNMAATKGIFFVSSAGNDWSAGILTPGDADSALCVGSVKPDRTPAAAAAWGQTAEA